jgi:hypothetical protein
MGLLGLFAFTNIDFKDILLKRMPLESPKLFKNYFNSISNKGLDVTSIIRLVKSVLDDGTNILKTGFISFLSCYQQLSYFIFRSKDNLKLLFWLAVLTHGIETVYALTVGFRIGIRETIPVWVIQTCLLGGPSMNLILERARFMKGIDEMKDCIDTDHDYKKRD